MQKSPCVQPDVSAGDTIGYEAVAFVADSS
jgi:hypothetical protein